MLKKLIDHLAQRVIASDIHTGLRSGCPGALERGKVRSGPEGRVDRDPLIVGPAELAAFVTELAAGREGKPPVAPATLQRKIACLRSFYRHLRREQIIDHDPTAELRPPRSPGRLPKVLTRDEILDALWSPDYAAASNVVDQQIRGLRAKLNSLSRKPNFIATVPGQGYRFVPEMAKRAGAS